jgi:hypothetical protein
MKYLKLFEELNSTSGLTPEQIEWLDKSTAPYIHPDDDEDARLFDTGPGKWSINPQTGLVDVEGDFNCMDTGIKDLKGVNFGHVTGTFVCEQNNIQSLKGAPIKVGKNFYCSVNKLRSLEGAPREIGGTFECVENSLVSLKGGPVIVKGSYIVNFNGLKSLTGAPQEVGKEFCCDEVLIPEWNIKGFIKGFKDSPNLVKSLLTPEMFKEADPKGFNKLMKQLDNPKTLLNFPKKWAVQAYIIAGKDPKIIDSFANVNNYGFFDD